MAAAGTAGAVGSGAGVDDGYESYEDVICDSDSGTVSVIDVLSCKLSCVYRMKC